MIEVNQFLGIVLSIVLIYLIYKGVKLIKYMDDYENRLNVLDNKADKLNAGIVSDAIKKGAKIKNVNIINGNN